MASFTTNKPSKALKSDSGNHYISTVTKANSKHLKKSWTIHNFDGVITKPGTICHDRDFEFGQHLWRLRLYPGGVSETVGNYVSLYLDCLDATEDNPAREKHTFRLLNHVSDERHFEQKSLPLKTHADRDGWGWGKFIAHTVLQNGEFIKNNSITIEMDLTVYSPFDLPVIDVSKNPFTINVTASTFIPEFSTLFENEDFTDITIVVEDVEFKAHRVVLAVRCQLLAGQFQSGMKDSTIASLTVIDSTITPLIFREILRYIYTDQVDTTVLQEDPTHLMAAADIYGLDRLKLICEETMAKKMNAETCGWMLLAADQHHAEQLKRCCLLFIVRNMKAIVETESFQHLMLDHPQLMKEILLASTSSNLSPDSSTRTTCATEKRLDQTENEGNKDEEL